MRNIPIVAALAVLAFTAAAFGQSAAPKLPKIIINPAFKRPEKQTTWKELEKRAMSLRSPACNANDSPPHFEFPMRLRDSLKGRVKTLRVVGFSPRRDVIEVVGVAPRVDTTRFSKLRETLVSVWEGRFQVLMCVPQWAEGSDWFVEVRLEFADGKSGTLITDGRHVALQDHDGMTWYLPLIPAAQ